MTDTDALRAAREATVREHMQAENALDFDRALATFGHPRYELIATGQTHDGPVDVMRYFRDSRTAFPDQRNELISLRHTDDAVIVEFWLLGTHKGRLGNVEPTGKRSACAWPRSSSSTAPRSSANASTSTAAASCGR